jgi:hypothetical protein
MVGVRFVSKPKAKGSFKPKPVPGYRVAVTKGFDSQHTGINRIEGSTSVLLLIITAGDLNRPCA